MKRLIKTVFYMAVILTLTVVNSPLSHASDDNALSHINVYGYQANFDYLKSIEACVNDGSKVSILYGARLERERNNKIDILGLPLYKTNIFTSFDPEVVRSNYAALITDFYVKYQEKLEQEKLAIETSVASSLPQQEEQNKRYIGNYKLSFYCSCSKCCGKSDGITASGAHVKEGETIAVDTSVIPLGSKVYIEGWGTYIAQDTGSGINGNRIDVYVSSHQKALQYGIKYANAYILN